MRTLRSNKGFTLIELMIVVVIIGILAAIALPRFGSVSRNAKEAEALPVLRQICTLQSVFREENGAFAANIGALTTFVDPVTKHYTFTTTDAPTAVATRRTETAIANSGVRSTITLNCATGALAYSAN